MEESSNVERVQRSGSRLPALLAALGAVVLAVLLIQNGKDPNEQPGEGPEDAATISSSIPPTVTTELPADPSGYSLLASADQTTRRFSFARMPSSPGVAPQQELFMLVDGEFRSRLADRDFSILGRVETFPTHPGERRDHLLSTETGTVVTSLGEGRFYPFDLDRPAVELGEGFAVLDADGATAWLLTSAERTARLVDLPSGSEVRTVDLSVSGRVLDATNRGLIVAGDPGGEVGLVGSNDSLRTIAGTAGAIYLGSAGPVAVFADDAQLLISDLDTPERPPRTVPNPEPRVYRSAVSPDGALLAVSIVTSITEPNRIVVLDLDDGDERHRIVDSVQVLFQWSSPTDLLYLRPDWPAVELAERNIEVGSDSALIRFENLNWWYSATERDATIHP